MPTEAERWGRVMPRGVDPWGETLNDASAIKIKPYLREALTCPAAYCRHAGEGEKGYFKERPMYSVHSNGMVF